MVSVASAGAMYHNVQDPGQSILMLCSAQIWLQVIAVIQGDCQSSRYPTQKEGEEQRKAQVHFFPLKVMLGNWCTISAYNPLSHNRPQGTLRCVALILGDTTKNKGFYYYRKGGNKHL